MPVSSVKACWRGEFGEFGEMYYGICVELDLKP